MAFPPASEATYFQDDIARAAREAEVVGADFLNGMNMGGSNACGIGINMNEGPIIGTPEQFTLLDQHGNARAAQISQSLGGHPFVAAAAYPSSGGTEGTLPDAVIRYGDAPVQSAKDADPSIDGTIIPVGNSTLTTLAGGWVIQV